MRALERPARTQRIEHAVHSEGVHFMTYPPDGFERRREPRLATSLDTIVEVTWYASVFKARTIDRSYHGVLLEFDSAPKIPIGDLVVLDLMAPDPNWKLRPYLGIGKVARIQGSRMGITLDLSDLISLPEAPSIREGLEVYG